MCDTKGVVAACAMLKPPSLTVGSQPRDVCVRCCTVPKSVGPNLDSFSRSPRHKTVEDFVGIIEISNKRKKVTKNRRAFFTHH